MTRAELDLFDGDLLHYTMSVTEDEEGHITLQLAHVFIERSGDMIDCSSSICIEEDDE